nr:TetR/AcrR family transcriptional regulator [Geodermatophilus sabuli]
MNDRRARKKAQTRALIRSVAQDLFAERGFEAVTIADIATTADVAVQTVFNHFCTKEELFFDGRTPWVDGPAEAVRSRPPGVPPLTALRRHLVGMVAALAGAHTTEQRRRFIATIEASAALRVRELELVHEAERRLAEALTAAWSDGPYTAPDPVTAASLTAATWLAAVRVLLVSQRPVLGDHVSAARSAARIESLADQVLGQLQEGLGPMHAGTARPTAPGWPDAVRRTG